MTPLNIQAQWTINIRGKIIEKDRLTHYQSFEWMSSGTSVNSRIDTNLLQQCKFEKCLNRLINWAVMARRRFPNKRILAKKDNVKSAYHWMHLHHKTAVKTVTQIPELHLALMSLCLTFGSTPGPYKWGVMSETICDLINEMIMREEWQPEQILQLPQKIISFLTVVLHKFPVKE